MTNAERCLNRYRTNLVAYFASEASTTKNYWCDRANRYGEIARKRYGYRIRTLATVETEAERYVQATGLQLG